MNKKRTLMDVYEELDGQAKEDTPDTGMWQGHARRLELDGIRLPPIPTLPPMPVEAVDRAWARLERELLDADIIEE